MDFQTKLEQYEGPLELLLKLIEREELDISEISLANVTDQFLEFLRTHEIGPGSISEFLLIASQLLVIKSRILIPSLVLEKEEEEDITELKARLEDYRRFQRVANMLMAHEAKHEYAHVREPLPAAIEHFAPPQTLTCEKLQELLMQMIRENPEPEILPKQHLEETISIEHRIMELHKRLKTRVQETFSSMVKGSRGKPDIIVTFLAILELFKQHVIVVEQQTLHGEIIIRSRTTTTNS